jgi:hypothetical protein
LPPKPTRKGVPKKKKENKGPTLFDFLNDITYDKKNILNKENEHIYSKFMITKFLSMNKNFLPVVDIILNRYQDVLSNEEFHQLCIGLIKKQKIFLKYNSPKPLKEQSKKQIQVIGEYFKVSEDTTCLVVTNWYKI